MTVDPKVPPPTKERIHYIEGIRAACAFYVLFFHVAQSNQAVILGHPVLSGYDKMSTLVFMSVLRYGKYAVDAFIVISGYCLMLPVARSQSDTLRWGMLDYAKRRARRILPPYYATLGFTLIAVWLSERYIGLSSQPVFSAQAEAFSPGAIWSHLLLVHNWTQWINEKWVNGPTWSIAVEWQIYFLFPLFLLPIWRRYGSLWLVLSAFIFGILLRLLSGSAGEATCPWYVGLFALGMVAAVINFRRDRPERRLLQIPLGRVAVVLYLLLAALWMMQSNFATHMPMLSTLKNAVWSSNLLADMLMGLLTAIILVKLTEACREEGGDNQQTAKAARRTELILRLFQNPFLTWVGMFSYSLYLTHWPIIQVLSAILKSIGISQIPAAILLYLLSFGICVGFAYVFYLAFERPFLTPRPSSSRTQSRVSGNVSAS